MRLTRDSIAAVLASGVVLVVILLGFYKTHGPRTQRTLRADARRIQNVRQLADQIYIYYHGPKKELPSELTDLQKKTFQDPLSGKPLDYHPKSATQYEICTTFLQPNTYEEMHGMFEFWNHPGGYKCFEFDANGSIPPAPNVYYW